MKKTIKYLSSIALCMSLILVSSCTNEIGGESDFPVVPDSKIKKIIFDSGDGIESWEFVYDASGRVTSIANSWENGAPEMITYDYTQAGKLQLKKGGKITNFTLDAEGRITKELWNSSGTEYVAFEYDSEGILKKVLEHYDNVDHLKFENKINKSNITNRIRYEDNGVTVRENRVFEYTIANNTNAIHQIFTVDSQWKNVGGLYGKQSKKLVKNYVRKLASDPDSNYGASFAYTFDTKNRVATQTKNGKGSGGSFSESWKYSYYE